VPGSEERSYEVHDPDVRIVAGLRRMAGKPTNLPAWIGADFAAINAFMEAFK
jgi:hypothetical protein